MEPCIYPLMQLLLHPSLKIILKMPFSARPIPVFKKDGILEMTLSCNGDTEIPNAVGTYNNSTYSCINPGAFTLDGNTGYCFKTSTL